MPDFQIFEPARLPGWPSLRPVPKPIQKKVQSVTLNNGVNMPILGLGVYNMYGRDAVLAVEQALQVGYRLIDSATMYRNESEIGQAVRNSGLPRADVFITTKVDNADQGYDQTLKAFDTSLRKLGMEYVDLYLIHWPIRDKRKDTWMALEKIYADGRARAIGVANYLIPFLQELKGYASIVPALNQVEFSPYLYLQDLLRYCQQQGIQLQAYSPLARGERLQDPRLLALAKKYHKSAAQLMLRWDIQHGVSAIPKSVSPQRLRENVDLFDFQISDADMAIMDGFHENLRLVGNPIAML